jgi:hypothetical protein
MTEHDLNNVKFLISLSPSEYEEWCKEATGDDFDYAFEIIAQFRKEMLLNVTLLSDPDVSSLETANHFLQKYRK